MTLERAVDVFGAGFCYTRSFTHPYEYARVGPLRVMRDGPRTKGDYRLEEIVPFGISPQEAVEAIRAYHPRRFALAVIHSMEVSPKEIKEGYKGLGFRLLRTEPMMVREVRTAQLRESPYPILRVRTPEQAEAVASVAGSRQILEPDLVGEDPSLRLYAAFDGEEPVGWVRSIRAEAGACWVSNMYVVDRYRRRGLGSALMTAMLVDDARHGIEWSVLLASVAGARLYESLGYEQLGLDQLFMPDKNRWP